MRPRTLALFIFSVMALVAWLGLTGCTAVQWQEFARRVQEAQAQQAALERDPAYQIQRLRQELQWQRQQQWIQQHRLQFCHLEGSFLVCF